MQSAMIQMNGAMGGAIFLRSSSGNRLTLARASRLQQCPQPAVIFFRHIAPVSCLVVGASNTETGVLATEARTSTSESSAVASFPSCAPSDFESSSREAAAPTVVDSSPYPPPISSGPIPSAQTAHTKSGVWTSLPVFVVNVHNSVGRLSQRTQRRFARSAPTPAMAAFTARVELVKRMNTSSSVVLLIPHSATPPRPASHWRKKPGRARMHRNGSPTVRLPAEGLTTSAPGSVRETRASTSA
mmetsp:Transcript_30810/g.72896  ORF Transcript_30810/g.72896 Transcript_30810/m.72896 type:complete len:243 (-) Transcript_30810:1303-2031(-)